MINIKRYITNYLNNIDIFLYDIATFNMVKNKMYYIKYFYMNINEQIIVFTTHLETIYSNSCVIPLKYQNSMLFILLIKEKIK